MPLLLIVALMSACGSRQSGSLPAPRQAPTALVAGYNDKAAPRVMVVVLENREFGEVIGNKEAPFLNGLADRFGLATRTFGTTHPSLPNYLALISGSTQGISSDCTTCSVDGRTLVDQLQDKGIGWRAYMEGMPSPCFLGASNDGYDKKHNPFLYFNHIRDDPALCHRVVPLDLLAGDLASGTAPPFIWVTKPVPQRPRLPHR